MLKHCVPLCMIIEVQHILFMFVVSRRSSVVRRSSFEVICSSSGVRRRLSFVVFVCPLSFVVCPLSFVVFVCRSSFFVCRSSSFFVLLRPSSSFFVLLRPSSSFFVLLRPSLFFFVLLRSSSFFFVLLCSLFAVRSSHMLLVLILVGRHLSLLGVRCRRSFVIIVPRLPVV